MTATRMPRLLVPALSLLLVATACAAPADEADPAAAATVHTTDSLVPAVRSALAEVDSVHLEATARSRPAEGGAAGAGAGAVRAVADLVRDPDTPGLDGHRARVRVRGLPFTVGEVEVRLAEGAVYVAAVPFTEPGRFVQVDLDELGERLLGPRDSAQRGPGRLDVPGLSQLHAFGPGRFARHLRRHLRDVEHLGEATEGQETWQRYRLTLGRHRVQLWLDQRDLPRRVVAQQAGRALRVELSGWGERVEVAVPAPEDVREPPALPFPGLLEQFSDRGGSAARP